MQISKFTNKKTGFTLVELLVVISIIGILASIALASFTTSQRQARDTQRKSDLKQYSASLEAFANAGNGLYPSHTTKDISKADNTLCGDLGLTNCPADPSDPTNVYKYISNGGNTGIAPAKATSYVLWSKLESDTNNYWVVCSSGKTGKYATSQGQPSNDGLCPSSL